ncbi:hypothetical protein Y1Q_0001375 [Alligator mississippiensis]|uniref:Uncharacterized protein n=1 Tax=Alligator mississippiensis TaxID=8496 RepID=A0A151M9E9_ALLMI|nr:hypothetical protein Y1Q_0001375 [Alligator mississippiensis]
MMWSSEQIDTAESWRLQEAFHFQDRGDTAAYWSRECVLAKQPPPRVSIMTDALGDACVWSRELSIAEMCTVKKGSSPHQTLATCSGSGFRGTKPGALRVIDGEH